MGIKAWFTELMVKFGIGKAKHNSTILKDLIDNPESVKLEAYIEGEEIIVKIRKKDES